MGNSQLSESGSQQLASRRLYDQIWKRTCLRPQPSCGSGVACRHRSLFLD